MQITYNVAPPADQSRRQDYADLTAAVTTAAGSWIAIPLCELRGTRNKDKQTTVIQAARQRGVRVETACRGDQMYLRLRPEGR